jgi:hypothetical protein
MTLVAISIRTRGLQQGPYEIAKIDEASDHFLSQPAVVLMFLLVGREFIAPPSVSGLSHCSQSKRLKKEISSGSFSELCAGAHCLLEDRFCSGQSCISYLQWTHAAAAAAVSLHQSVSQSVSWRELLESLKE